MQITRSELDTTKGPADWFTGDVHVDTVVAAPAPARSQGGLVHFTPGARTAWRSHPLGQTVFVTEGVGRCQRRIRMHVPVRRQGTGRGRDDDRLHLRRLYQ